MKLSLFLLLSTLTSTSAFLGQSLRTAAPAFAARSSQLQMVADDAKVCLVTGSSRGLGRAIAVELGKYGQKVVVNYMSPGSTEAAEETVKLVKEAGGDAIAVMGDASKPESIQAIFDAALEKFGTVDVLVNNAGITKDTLVLRMKPEQWQAVIDVNLSGVFYMTQAFFKMASKKRSGRIINMSSVVGQIGNIGQANYAAAKGGILGMTKSNAKEFAARGITVNAICPGFIASDMTAKLEQDYLDKMAESIPLKRLGKPEEVAGLTRFLAIDPAAEYITGHEFNVDGGIAIGV